MKDSPDIKTAAGGLQKNTGLIQAAIAFAATLIGGSIITAISGLFVYANVTDVHQPQHGDPACLGVHFDIGAAAADHPERR